jgi:hypothetical protein
MRDHRDCRSKETIEPYMALAHIASSRQTAVAILACEKKKKTYLGIHIPSYAWQ